MCHLSPLPVPLTEEETLAAFSSLRLYTQTRTRTRALMELQTWTCGLLVLSAVFRPAEATSLYDPKLCYILDGFLGLYGVFITGMFIREKFFRGKVKSSEEGLYIDLKGPDSGGGYAPLRRDPEGGRNRRMLDQDPLYTGLTKRPDGEYKELPVRKERQRKNEQVYQGLSSATRDTYDQLQMQPLPAR